MSPADQISPNASVDERLAKIREIEQREARAMRKATAAAWVSVSVAALLLAVIVFGAWQQLQRMRSEAAKLTAEQSALESRIDKQKAELADLERERRDKQAALSTLIGAVRRTDERARDGLGTALDADPRAAVLVPRAYVQIADDGDRQWARNLGDRLQQGGVIPVGVALVQEAGALRRFEVRYNKKAEEGGAQRILAVLENAGVPAEPVYLDLENNTRVGQNHFEIWCPPNARQFKLRPLQPLAP